MPCIASDFKRELRPPFRFPHPSETLVTGDARPRRLGQGIFGRYTPCRK